MFGTMEGLYMSPILSDPRQRFSLKLPDLSHLSGIVRFFLPEKLLIWGKGRH